MDWLDDQVRRGRIEEDAARCICWEDILQFAKSGIGRRLREADGKQRLWREQPFVLGIDARELYPEQLRYYAKALEQMTGKKVKEKIIYSFTLKEGIYIK